MEFESLSRSLKAIRELTGLSQYELARLTGISRCRVSLVECGHSQLNEDEHRRAERALRAAITDRYKNFKSIVEHTPGPAGRRRKVAKQNEQSQNGPRLLPDGRPFITQVSTCQSSQGGCGAHGR